MVVGAVVATILVGGIIGQAAASAATEAKDEQPPTQTPVTVDPQSGDAQLSKTSAIHLGSGHTGTDEGTSFDAAGASGAIVDLGGGVLFLVPKGFTIEEPGPGFAQVYGNKGYFFAYLTPTKSTLTKLVTNNVTGIQNMGVQQLQITQPKAVQVSGVNGAATLSYRGLLATQQGGSIPVEGFAFYFVRSDGTGATAFALYGKGALKPRSKLLTGYNTMLNTLISTL